MDEQEEEVNTFDVRLGDSFLQQGHRTVLLHYDKKPPRLVQEVEGSMELKESKDETSTIRLVSRSEGGEEREDLFAGRQVELDFCALVFDEETQEWTLEQITDYIGHIRKDEDENR